MYRAVLCFVLVCLGFGAATEAQCADLVFSHKEPNGIAVWRDPYSGEHWAFWHAATDSNPHNGWWNARLIVRNTMGYGYNLPTAGQLSRLRWQADHIKLRLPCGPWDYYWTANPKSVMCPAGNGFVTEFPIQYEGSNYIIAVRPW